MEIEFVMTQTDAADRCAQQLARRGIHTTICERSGEAALRVILEKRPAMVLLEAFLPELDAIAVKQRCDEAGLTATRFFAMGGFQNEAVEQQLMDAGFLFYFVKPISPEALAQRLAGISGTAARQKGVSDEMQVSEILHQIGVPAHIKGYQFLRDAILLTTGDPELGSGRCGGTEQLFRLHHPQPPGQAHQFGVYRHDRRPYAAGKTQPPDGLKTAVGWFDLQNHHIKM